jgi:hypothetical protein
VVKANEQLGKESASTYIEKIPNSYIHKGGTDDEAFTIPIHPGHLISSINDWMSWIPSSGSEEEKNILGSQ